MVGHGTRLSMSRVEGRRVLRSGIAVTVSMSSCRQARRMASADRTKVPRGRQQPVKGLSAATTGPMPRADCERPS